MIKLAHPTRHKRFWLEALAQAFSAAVQYGLDGAYELRTSSRGKIHQRCYPPMRACFGLPSDYARMAVNAAVSRARSYYGCVSPSARSRPPTLKWLDLRALVSA